MTAEVGLARRPPFDRDASISLERQAAEIWPVVDVQRMVDLDQFQGSGGTEHARNGRCRFDDLLLTASFGTLLKVDVLKASHYRSAMRRHESGRNAVCPHIPDRSQMLSSR